VQGVQQLNGYPQVTKCSSLLHTPQIDGIGLTVAAAIGPIGY